MKQIKIEIERYPDISISEGTLDPVISQLEDRISAKPKDLLALSRAIQEHFGEWVEVSVHPEGLCYAWGKFDDGTITQYPIAHRGGGVWYSVFTGKELMQLTHYQPIIKPRP